MVQGTILWNMLIPEIKINLYFVNILIWKQISRQLSLN